MAVQCPVPYSKVYMKQRLLELLDEKVTITLTRGMVDVVTFNETAASIIHQYHKDSRNPQNGQKELIIRTAASLIKSHIVDKYTFHSKDLYPNPTDFERLYTNLEFLPKTIKLFFRLASCG